MENESDANVLYIFRPGMSHKKATEKKTTKKKLRLRLKTVNNKHI